MATSSIFGFTSGPEVLAANPADAAVSMTVSKVVDMARAQGHRGIVINPAGPWFEVSLAEIAGQH